MLNYDALRGHLDNILAQMKEYQFQLQMVVFLLLYISYGKSSADMLLLSCIEVLDKLHFIKNVENVEKLNFRSKSTEYYYLMTLSGF